MALHYGADAVYAGVPKWSLRVRGNGFIKEDFMKGIEEAHAMGKKVHAVLNIIPHVRRVAAFEKVVDEMAQLKPDAFIISTGQHCKRRLCKILAKGGLNSMYFSS